MASPRSLEAEWARLAGPPAPSDTFAAGTIAGLPEPARRWLSHTIAPGTPLWSSAEITMRGEITMGSRRSFTAREVLTPSGFIWTATTRVAGIPVSGFDRYSSGTGQMRWRLLGVIPVMTAAGADVTRSAAGRLAGELFCWLPTSFASASWSAGPDPDTAAATRVMGDQDETVLLRVDPDGRLVELRSQRWGNPDGQPHGRYPFGVAVEAERRHDGVAIASSIRAGWWWGTERQDAGEFFRAEITDATFR